MSDKNTADRKPLTVVTDAASLRQPPVDFSALQKITDLKIHDFTAPDELPERAENAEILIVNKTKIGADILQELPDLKCICLTATGYNNIDLAAAEKQNVTVCNVSGYSTYAVAQHVFALMSALQNRVEAHHETVQNGDWSAHRDFSYTVAPIHEFYGKTIGIYGFGRIGRQVGKIALAYGMHVLSTHKHPQRDATEGVEFVDFDTLLQESDYLTLHAPLTDENAGIIRVENLQKMKSSAVLINTGRGGLVNENDLRTALQNGTIAAAGLDVLSQEPPPQNHPLFGLKNCLITPHVAWAAVEARERLVEETVKNVKAYLRGEPRNVVL